MGQHLLKRQLRALVASAALQRRGDSQSPRLHTHTSLSQGINPNLWNFPARSPVSLVVCAAPVIVK